MSHSPGAPECRSSTPSDRLWRHSRGRSSTALTLKSARRVSSAPPPRRVARAAIQGAIDWHCHDDKPAVPATKFPIGLSRDWPEPVGIFKFQVSPGRFRFPDRGECEMTNRTLTGFSLGAVILATSIACGHQTGPTAPNPVTPAPSSPPSPAPVTNTVPAANNGVVGVYRTDVTMPYSGTASVTLSWPNADFSLQLFVTSGVCADTTSLLTGTCTVLGSTRQGTLPGVVT